jgi:hypothetical protein
MTPAEALEVLIAEVRALRGAIHALLAERAGPPATLEALEESLGDGHGVAVGDRVLASVPGGDMYVGTITHISEDDHVQVDGLELLPGHRGGCNVPLADVEVITPRTRR